MVSPLHSELVALTREFNQRNVDCDEVFRRSASKIVERNYAYITETLRRIAAQGRDCAVLYITTHENTQSTADIVLADLRLDWDFRLSNTSAFHIFREVLRTTLDATLHYVCCDGNRSTGIKVNLNWRVVDRA